MRRVVVDIPEDLADERIAGLTVLEHWDDVLARSGARGAEGSVVHVDGRLLAIRPATVRRLAEGADAVPAAESLRVEGRAELARIERVWVDRKLEELASQGVVLHDASRIWVERRVEVAEGAVLWGGCVLRGRTKVGAFAVVHPGAVLDDTSVGEGTEIKAYSVCEGADIGPDCAVGPMAHLRPGTVLRRDVKVGNFVEVKKSTLEEGVRASHLSYLGDAEVGAHANIGAGTITCNYDGFGKHRTVIGPGAFVGSNTSLVAPVRIGQNAIVGAGSAVTRDVPDEALMVERAEERVLPDTAGRVRQRNAERARNG